MLFAHSWPTMSWPSTTGSTHTNRTRLEFSIVCVTFFFTYLCIILTLLRSTNRDRKSKNARMSVFLQLLHFIEKKAICLRNNKPTPPSQECLWHMLAITFLDMYDERNEISLSRKARDGGLAHFILPFFFLCQCKGFPNPKVWFSRFNRLLVLLKQSVKSTQAHSWRWMYN